VTSSEHGKAAGAFRQTLATYEAHRDLITLGAYKAGSDPEVDEAIELVADMNDFLVQDLDEDSPIEATIDHLLQLFG